MSKTRKIITAIITIIVMICATVLSVSAMTLNLYLDTPYPTTNSKINFKNSMQMNLQRDTQYAAEFRATVRVDAIAGATNIPSDYYNDKLGFRAIIKLSNAGIYNGEYTTADDDHFVVGDVNNSYFTVAKNYWDSSNERYLDHCNNVTMATTVFIYTSTTKCNSITLPKIELNSGKLIYSTN